MRKITLLTFLALSIIDAFAQDIIVKNDKTEIKAKIEELTETTIKYKKFEMLDGPSYNINKRDVFMVIYKNGMKEYIESSPDQGNTPVSSSQNTVTERPQSASMQSEKGNNGVNSVMSTSGKHEKFVQKGKFYYFEGEKITKTRQAEGILQERGSYEVQELLAGAKVYKTLGYLGGILGAAGISTTAPGLLVGGGIGKPGLFLGSAVLMGAGFFSIKFYGKEINKANKLFQQEGYEPKVSFKPMIKSDFSESQIGISFGF